MARASRPTTRSCARSCRSTRAGRSSTSEGQPFKVEILDDLRGEGQGGRASRCRRYDVLRARPVHRPVPWPARRVDGQDRPVQAARVSRRVLAGRPGARRRCSASTARSGRRRRSWTSSCGGARRPRSATTAAWACSSTCSASTTSRPGRRSGTPRAGACTRRCATRCASSRTGAATRRSTRRRWCTRSCGSSPGHWDALPRQHVPRRGRGPDVQPQADELPRVDVHLPRRACARTATCRCACPSTACSTATSCRACCRA